MSMTRRNLLAATATLGAATVLASLDHDAAAAQGDLKISTIRLTTMAFGSLR